MAFKMDFDPERLKKLEWMIKNGYKPYGDKFEVSHSLEEIRREFNKLDGRKVSIAGRVLARRDHGKLKFFDLIDQSGNIQIYIAEDNMDERSNKLVDWLDSGDIIGVKGKVSKTKRGEISIVSNEITILAKSLLPLPSKWYGLEDTEKRYRRRHIDFIMNPDTRDKIVKGAKMVSAIRDLLERKGFIEVVVPVLQPIPGGTNATPFITHYKALDRDLYLKIASELYLKRLLVGGFEKIFDISKNFRNEGVDTRHNPEFMAMELYQAYGDLGDMMSITEEIVKAAIYAANGTYVTKFGEHTLDFTKFYVKTMEDSVKEAVGNLSEEKIIERAKQIDKKVVNYGEAVNVLFEEEVQKSVIQPTFITKHPIDTSPLAKKMEDDPRFVYRFELYVAGMEIANAFSELNDPLDQIDRFNLEASRKERGIDETQEFDRDFIEALACGMPPTGGLGIGIDRLQMLGTNSRSIKDVIPFPQLRTLED